MGSNAVASLPGQQPNELLRLRGQVGVLRRQLAEVAAREASERTQYQHSAQEMDASVIKRAAMLADQEARMLLVSRNSLEALASALNVPVSVSKMNSQEGLRDENLKQYELYFFFKKWCEAMQSTIEDENKARASAQ
jgi:hypothetical protein